MADSTITSVVGNTSSLMACCDLVSSTNKPANPVVAWQYVEGILGA